MYNGSQRNVVSVDMVFVRIDGDGEPEIIAATDMGDLVALTISGENFSNYYPIVNSFSFSGNGGGGPSLIMICLAVGD